MGKFFPGKTDLLWKKKEKNHCNNKITFLSSEAQARKRPRHAHTQFIYIYIYVKLLYIRFTPHPGFQSPPRLVFIFVGKTYKPLFATGILGEGRSNIKGGTNYCGPEKASLIAVGLELVNSGAPNKFPLRKGMENP